MKNLKHEIGDNKADTFYPQIKLMKWDNECNMSVRLDVDHTNALIEQVGKKIKWKKNDIEAEFYELEPEDAYGAEDGGFEFSVLLKTKPKKPEIRYTIETKGLDYFRQPSLTQEQINSGRNRPKHIVGSYAVYHNNKRHNEYKTGKALHIYKPFARDFNGNQVWCGLHIDRKKKELIISLPFDFWNSATYPVLIDPTFGYTSIGGSNYSLVADNAAVSLGTPTSNGTVDSISIYADNVISTNVKGCIWDGTTEAVITNGVGGVVSINTSGPKWFTMTYSTSPSVTASTDYYVGVVTDGAILEVFYDAGGTDSGGWDDNNSYSSPWTLNRAYPDDIHSLYATYTESSGPSPTGYSLYYRKSGTTYSGIIYTGNTGMTEDMQVRVGGSTGYVALDSTGHADATDLRVRKGGTTYAVLSGI